MRFLFGLNNMCDEKTVNGNQTLSEVQVFVFSGFLELLGFHSAFPGKFRNNSDI